jgi:FixJ family two-component response regulator
MTTGEECIRYFSGQWRSKDGEAPEPCLLFLDLAMYPIGGLEVLEKIRGYPIAKRSLKIMLSGINDIKMVRQGYQSGADTFLIKPLGETDVLEFFAATKSKIHIIPNHEGNCLHWSGQHFEANPLKSADRPQTSAA